MLLLLGVSIVTFLLMCASPLDPLQTNVGQAALGTMSQEQIAKLEPYWGTDTPPLERYIGWLGMSCTVTLELLCSTGSRCSQSSDSVLPVLSGCSYLPG